MYRIRSSSNNGSKIECPGSFRQRTCAWSCIRTSPSRLTWTRPNNNEQREYILREIFHRTFLTHHVANTKLGIISEVKVIWASNMMTFSFPEWTVSTLHANDGSYQDCRNFDSLYVYRKSKRFWINTVTRWTERNARLWCPKILVSKECEKRFAKFLNGSVDLEWSGKTWTDGYSTKCAEKR